MSVLMPMLYLPPVSYMAILHAAGEIYIEAQENYIKSTYRNRCEILGSNGIIDLSIPLIGGRDHHQLYRESEISYINDWQHRHYMSILSCYGSAPFFEHYMSYLGPFFEKQHKYLFQFNKELLELMIKLMKLDMTISYTDVYENAPDDMTDLRKAFKPGKSIEEIIVEQKKWQVRQVLYMQVFDGIGNSLSVSCLDLLFNEGPQSKNILKQMVITS